MMRAASSNNDGGLCVISDTNLTTNGLSRKDNCEKRIKFFHRTNFNLVRITKNKNKQSIQGH